jgi:energy-coupling factor transporter ATP-binding protein EcfA2
MQKINTFLPAFGNKPKHIIGRNETILAFTEGLSLPTGNRQRAMLLIGQRGTGKTALLLAFNEIAEKQGYITARVTANEEMLEEIIQTIQVNGSKTINSSKSKIRAVSAGALGFSLGLTFTEETERKFGFRVKLAMLCDELAKQKKGVLILVDEVQPNTSQMRHLATTYQHLVGENKNIAIAMAGLPGSMSAVLNDDILTFLNRAHKAHLAPLPISEISVYYAEEFEKLGKTIPPEELESAAIATKGYPYLFQLIGHYMLAFSRNANVITSEIVTSAINSSKRDLVDSIFVAALKSLSAGDMKFLSAMAIDGENSMIKDIIARLGISSPHAQKYRTRLIEAGIIAPVRRGELAFELPFLGEYLRDEF